MKGLSTVSLRYFNVFGPGQHPESKYAAVFPAFIKALSAGEAPEVHWDGEQTRDFSYIDDVVRANLAAANAPEGASGEVFNIGGGGPRTANEALRALADAIGHPTEPVYRPKRAGDIRHTHAEIAKARGLLAWDPVADWPTAVIRAVEEFLGSLRNPDPAPPKACAPAPSDRLAADSRSSIASRAIEAQDVLVVAVQLGGLEARARVESLAGRG